MSHVALVGASGRVGSKITEELASRGHTVTAIARNPEKIPVAEGVTPVAGDFQNPQELAKLLKGHDAIIGSIPFITGESEKMLEAVRLSGVKRYLMVGGAASLRTETGEKVVDALDLPEEWMPPIREGMRTYELIQKEDSLDWTFFSPAVMIEAGERTGKFRLGKDHVVKNEQGESRISFADYAIAMVDELEQGNSIKARFTIGY